MSEDLTDGHGRHVLLLAHGAGAPMDSPFMDTLANALGQQDVQVIRFEFDYMQRRREDGKKRPPPKVDKLLSEFQQKIEQYAGAGSLFIGGKSMGGRVASLVAASQTSAVGCICFGYPFHPPGKPDRWRTEHLHELSVPVLLQQGTRDPFGRQDEVIAHFDGHPPATIDWLEDGEHDFKPRKASGLTQQALIDQAASNAARWMKFLASA